VKTFQPEALIALARRQRFWPNPRSRVKIVDELDRVRNLIQAADLVAQTIPDGAPLEAVLTVAEAKLTEARNALDEVRPKSFWTGKPDAANASRGAGTPD
jgi:hypothetical protein